MGAKFFGTPVSDRVLEKLKEVARQHSTCTYGEIFEIMNLRAGNYAASQAGQLLGEISERMHLAGKPMLSALVVNKNSGVPGQGFFELAITLGKIPSNSTEQERIAFWEKEVSAIYSIEW